MRAGIASAHWWASALAHCSILYAMLGVVTGAHADGIDDFNNSWAGRALIAQRLLDRQSPLAEINIVGSHNSYNSAAYTTSTSYIEPNQIDSIYNQLRMGMRAVEFDVHWTPKTEGPFNFPDRLLLCHGTSDHTGCSPDDRYFAEGLDEIAAWLNSAASIGQVIILHIEDHMDGRHGEAFDQVNARFGNRVYGSGGCRDIPGDLTKAAVLAAGKNVLIWNEGGCSGNGNWNSIAFTGLGALSRVWENSLGGGSPGTGAPIGDNDVRNYFAGGTNIVDLDQMQQNDSRLPAAIWSWDVNEPNNLGGNEDCAVQHANGRWNDAQCTQEYVFACESTVTGSWAVSATADGWGGGALACDGLGPDYQFGVPTNSLDNQLLKQAKDGAGASSVWLNHDDRDGEGIWQVNGADSVFYAAGTVSLDTGQSLSGTTRLLRMEPNCNLVLYSVEDGVIGGGLWTSDTANSGTGCRTDFQADGNLVVYDGGGQALWASGTSGTSGAELHLQSDGNAVIYNGAGEPLWSTHTSYAAEYYLNAGQFSLNSGQILHSGNRKLEMQSDCSLVLHSFENGITGGPLWHSDTSGAGTSCRADFQSDGNFVVYDGGGQPHWASGTSGTTGAQLRLQADGNLVVYNGAGQPLWNSGTAIPGSAVMNAGQFALSAGQFVQTQTRKLEMQADCNLVMLSIDNALEGATLWHSDTAGAGSGCYADFQADGNFVVYNGGGQALWTTGTSGTTGAQLRLQEDGNLVVYNGAGQPLWSSNTAIPAVAVFDAGQLLLSGGQFVQTRNRRLEMQTDCNLVLSRVSNAVPGAALWHSDTSLGGSNCVLDFQADGNLVVYDGGGQAKWASGTSGTSGAQLWVQPDGNVVIYNGAGQPLWSTSTAGNYSGASVCGDAICNGSETCSVCPGDCGSCPPVCGDFACNGGETCASCEPDCGQCGGGGVCGDAVCDGNESCSSCADDCGACPPVCGDLSCNGSETCATCEADCGACSTPECGDETCNGAETCSTCSTDCGACAPVCGDASCDGTETCSTCPDDCGACPPTCNCGDGVVEFSCGETCDDGNTAGGDGCDEYCLTEACPPAPLVGCMDVVRAKLQSNEKSAGKESLKIQWKAIAAAVAAADFGDPVDSQTSVSLCLYGDDGNLVRSFDIDRAGALCAGRPCWKARGAGGFLYKDKDASAGGISRLGLGAGDPGRGKIDAKARNNSARRQTALTAGLAAALADHTTVTAQVVTEAGFCATATMTEVRRSDSLQYKASKR